MNKNREESKLVLALAKGKSGYQAIRNILSHLDDLESIFILLSADGKIAYLNHSGCQLLRSTYESIVGLNWFDNFYPESNRKQVKVAFGLIMEGDLGHHQTCENKIKTAQGNTLIMRWDNSLIKSVKNGKVVGLFSLGKKEIDKRDLAVSHGLTSREIQVMTYFALGYNPKEVAQKLEIQPKTVYAHKINMFHKLGLSNHRDLVSFALKNRLLLVDDLVSD